ncbi:hypothetical protein GF378_02465 [Candidatus Pacearchaeota archaeon]|nr:hypothetical protein [Candidatus Pacearchaeota archaeon]
MFEKRKQIFGSILNKKQAQVTIFIIIAILLVASVAAFFIFRNVVQVAEVPANLEPAYNSFLSCIEEDTLTGINVLESQGGYIELPEFEQGSTYMPFSSHLNFLGNPIPYWYYVSGNNIQKEQVPSKSMMEEQLEEFVAQEIETCILDEWYGEGYTIIRGEEVEADVTINENDVSVVLDVPLRLEKANDTVLVNRHEVLVDSSLGKLYDSARQIYEYEQETLFLENYGVDTIRLYAPVDGNEITCAPKIWSADDVFNELEDAIVANVAALKVDSEELTLTEEDNKYFIVDLPVEENVRFLNSKQWPHSFEVNPTEGNLLVAEPVGNQPGMAALGFCYVPYHFVYDVNYPVLIQVYSESGEEIFQFPFAVVIQGNKPREPLDTQALDVPDPELCEYKNTEIQVNTFDNYLNPIQANISFACFGQVCNIGATGQDGSLTALFPQCINGQIVAEAQGYDKTKYFVESVEEGIIADLFLPKMYEQRVEIKLDGRVYSGEAVVTFINNETGLTETILYPDDNTVDLRQGQYDVEVLIYKNTTINIPETTREYCTEVTETGVGGFLGLTQEKCFDIEIPAQTVENALVGGGTESYYVLDSELESSSIIDINAEGLPTPRSIEDLQENYDLFENQDLTILFR